MLLVREERELEVMFALVLFGVCNSMMSITLQFWLKSHTRSSGRSQKRDAHDIPTHGESVLAVVQQRDAIPVL